MTSIVGLNVGFDEGGVDGVVDGDVLGINDGDAVGINDGDVVGINDGVEQLLVVGRALLPIVLPVAPLQVMQVIGHPRKALAPIVVVLVGIVILVRLPQ